jgi:aminopeptidase
MDQRINELAYQLIHYSVALQPGEKILIDLHDGADDFGTALVREAYAVGGIPFLNLESNSLKRAWIAGLSEDQAQTWYELELERMKRMDAYIAIRKSINPSELSDVPPHKLQLFNTWHGKLHLGQRCPHTRWCVLGYPSHSMAQQARMSTEAFEDYYYSVCNLDYPRLSTCMDPLKALMDRTKVVEIIAKDTHLKFSIEGCESSKCDGHANIPDGEVCMAVVQHSVEGTIAYNIPSNYNEFIFEQIKLSFNKGKVVEASANDSERLNTILDTDEGARYVGEFAIGVNPYVDRPVINTLFDEKMTGSIHLATGFGGAMSSAIHWDMIQSQNLQDGGGEIWFDGVLIRKNGVFVLEELLDLNPERFKNAMSG